MNRQQTAQTNIRQRTSFQASSFAKAVEAVRKPAIRFSYNAAGDCIATAITAV